MWLKSWQKDKGRFGRIFRAGDRVVYRLMKSSPHPGPRADAISPESRGEHYRYEVDKFWIVVDTPSEDRVLVQTRRGKQRLLSSDDPRLRHASYWERFVFGNRFPEVSAAD